MLELIITLSKKTKAEIKNLPHKILVNWDELIPSLQSVVRLRGDEIMEGIIITDKGIHACISRKRGKKVLDGRENLIEEDES